jgi:hypothetical protein
MGHEPQKILQSYLYKNSTTKRSFKHSGTPTETTPQAVTGGESHDKEKSNGEECSV